MASLGIVLISLKADDEIGRLLRHWNARNTEPALMANIETVIAMVKKVKENGYIRTDGLFTPNAGVLAVPFIVDDAVKPLALGIGGYSEIFRGNEEIFHASLTQAIREFHQKASLRRSESQQKSLTDSTT